jgi:hypothetical protein
MPGKSLIIAVAVILMLFGHTSAFAGSPTKNVPRLGIQFDLPNNFIVGRFKAEKLPESLAEQGFEAAFKNAAVLVEPGELQTPSGQVFRSDEIPVGDIPVIWLDRLRGNKARFMKAMLKEGEKKSIGGHVVYQLPGFPGPYGDSAFYYILPVDGGDVLEFGAHKFYFRGVHPKSEDPAQTHYDRIIEQVIATLEFISAP